MEKNTNVVREQISYNIDWNSIKAIKHRRFDKKKYAVAQVS